MLRFFPEGEPVTDTRVTRPPSAGNAGSGGASEVWTCSRGWADLEQNVPLGPGHR
jgi:hypothetical protein